MDREEKSKENSKAARRMEQTIFSDWNDEVINSIHRLINKLEVLTWNYVKTVVI